MKITKKHLKRIIKEEKLKVLAEFNAAARSRAQSVSRGGSSAEAKTSDEWIDFFQSVIDTELYDMGSSAEAEGHNIGDALEIVRVHFKDLARGPTRQ